MSAVAESPQPLVAQPSSTIVFLARREELRLIKTPRYPQFGQGAAGALGQRIGETRGVTFAFQDGTLRLKPDSEGNVTIMDPGGAGEATLPLEEALSFLRTHRRFMDVNEGFWEVSPTAPPVTREELDRIVAAATSWETDTLEAIIEQETAGWGREDILRVARGSIERIRAMEARADEEVAKVTAQQSAELEAEREQRAKIEAQLKAAQDEAKKLKAAAAKGKE